MMMGTRGVMMGRRCVMIFGRTSKDQWTQFLSSSSSVAREKKFSLFSVEQQGAFFSSLSSSTRDHPLAQSSLLPSSPISLSKQAIFLSSSLSPNPSLSFRETNKRFYAKKGGKKNKKKDLGPILSPPPSSSSDYYRILKVPKSATQSEIKKSYFKLARECHPDHHRNDPSAEARFKEIGEAYTVLSDPRKRAMYDRHGKEGVGQSHTDPDTLLRHLFGEGAFDDFFGDLSTEFHEDEQESDIAEIKKQQKRTTEQMREYRQQGKMEELEKELEHYKSLTKRQKAVQDGIDERKEAQEKEIDELCKKLAIKLVARTKGFSVENPGQFQSDQKVLAWELMDNPGGLGLVQVLGEAYVRESRRYFDDGRYPLGISRLVAWGSAIYEKGSMVMNLLSRSRKMKRMVAEKKKEDELLNEGIQTFWLAGKLMVNKRVTKICHFALGEKGVDPKEIERRARGVHQMGEIFIGESNLRLKDARTDDDEHNWQQVGKEDDK